jgi:hypothetical protein
MRLLLRDTLLIESPLAAADTLARLRAATGPRKLFRFGRVDYALEGEVDADRVEIQRVIYYRNSFLPRIRAVVEPLPRGSRLRGTLSLHPLVIAFLIVWFGALLAAPIAILLTLPREEPRTLFMLIPAAFLIVAWLLIAGVFSYEADRARKMLREILQAAADPESPALKTVRR